jgi:hypothetical protein
MHGATIKKYYSVDQIKKNEMGSAWGTYGNRKVVYRVLVEQTDGKRPLEDLDLDWGIILKFVFKKWDWELWTRFLWLRIRTVGGLL